MDYGVKVVLPGYDVDTATPEQCVVHSGYPPLKSKANQPSPHYATLEVNFSSGVPQGSNVLLYSFNHGYGYIPFNFASIKFTIPSQTLYGINYTGIGATLAVRAYCTSSQFRVEIYDQFNWVEPGSKLEVSYYVFAENG